METGPQGLHDAVRDVPRRRRQGQPAAAIRRWPTTSRSRCPRRSTRSAWCSTAAMRRARRRTRSRTACRPSRTSSTTRRWRRWSPTSASPGRTAARPWRRRRVSELAHAHPGIAATKDRAMASHADPPTAAKCRRPAREDARVDEIVRARPGGHLCRRRRRHLHRGRDLLSLLLPRLPAAGSRPVSALSDRRRPRLGGRGRRARNGAGPSSSCSSSPCWSR